MKGLRSNGIAFIIIILSFFRAAVIGAVAGMTQP